MKFDFVIGNPPYQEETEGTSDKPVYNLFMDASFAVAEKVELITPARFLFDAGKTPKAWNQKILADPHMKVLWYEQNSGTVFTNTDIKGGVAVTLRNVNKNFGAIEAFTSFPELNSILHRVVSSTTSFHSLDDEIVQQNKWNLDAVYADFPELKSKIGSGGKERRLTTSIFSLTELFHDKKQDGDVSIIGLISNKRFIKYVHRKYLDTHENLELWKVILPKSNGTGAIGEVLSTPLIGYTQSFISLCAFNNSKEAEALIKYIKSKFARCMLGILKITQDNNKGTWKYVPLQDFTPNSDIDWSQSIADIDRQLYRKYNLSREEIGFIESHVKEMT